MGIVNTCRQHGIENILVSSITCRPMYQNKVDKVNSLLKYYASIYGFRYIENSRIQPEHIKESDGVHLIHEGVCILADNYLAHINRHSLSQFQSFYD